MNPLLSVKNFLDQGGATLYVLVLCSVLLIAVVFERWYKIRSLLVDHEWLLDQMKVFLAQGDVPRALAFCRQLSGCLPRVFEAALYRADRKQADIESALGNAISEQNHHLERNLPIIGTMAVIAPFIGLFGTVMGIIRSFGDIAAKGASNPAVVSAGVAEALIATAAGLFVAIVSVVSFNYFKGMTKKAVSSWQVSSNKLVEMLMLSREKMPFPEDLRPQGMAVAPSYPAPQ